MSENFSLDLQGLSDDLILHVMCLLGPASSRMGQSNKRFYELGQVEVLWQACCESKGLKMRGDSWKETYETYCRCSTISAIKPAAFAREHR